MGRVNNTGVAVEVAAELGYLCAQFGMGDFAFVLFTFAMIIVWTNRRKATIPFFMIFLGCFLLNLRIFVGMTMTFLKDTGLASAFVLKGLAFFKDALSALRSFPMLFLLITNIKAFLMVKFRWLGARVNIWVWTFILWCFINIPWYSVIQLARGTDSKQDMVSFGSIDGFGDIFDVYGISHHVRVYVYLYDMGVGEDERV
ncbi:hypothetical protein BC829DRAFT_403303 [Chytridium lagenaria]|nr:hypothetical protein BC829DRAFT_403303 [Chytridium lagenaria]